MQRKKTFIISVTILLVGFIVTALIFITEPTAQMEGATKETAMLVEVTEVKRGTFQPVIVATGNVEPSQQITLSSQVGGEIVRISPSFTPGGFKRTDFAENRSF